MDARRELDIETAETVRLPWREETRHEEISDETSASISSDVSSTINNAGFVMHKVRME